MRKILLVLAILAIGKFSFSQDTLKIMQYNLLYYGLYTSFCTEDNNNLATKTEYLRKLINYVNPDIFGVNEINADADVQDYLLNNVFILNGHPDFARSVTVGNSGYLTTQIYYNRAKLVERGVILVDAYPRPIVIHKFYMNTRSLRNGDTVWLYIAVAHLKAGNTQDDADARAQATQYYMNKIRSMGPNNYIIMGDFNLYNSNEGAYQNLVNPSDATYKFHDPGPAGYWSNNSDFAAYHTQSTNYYGDDCRVGGGLDDRFDFILYSTPLTDNSLDLKVLPETFKVIGNDGNHFNSSVDYGGNSSVPDSILTVLKNNSDHLPITIKFVCSKTLSQVSSISQPISAFEIVNTAATNQVNFKINVNKLLKNRTVTYQIISSNGQVVKSATLHLDPNIIKYSIPVSDLPQGLYILRIIDKTNFYSQKFIKL